MERAPALLDGLARLLVPGCDRDVVQRAFAIASAGHAGTRLRDGRRASTLTPSGVPFEASVTSGPGRPGTALRYVTEPGCAMPFFGPRLAAQRRALDELAGWLPAPGRTGMDELRILADVLFPELAVVPARTRFATFLGVVHGPEAPAGVAGLKVYGSLQATDPAAALDRLAARWPPFAELRGRVGDLSCLAPQFAAIEVDARGRLRHKLYVRTRAAGPSDLAALASRCDVDIAPLAGALRQVGVPDDVCRQPLIACCAHRSDAAAGPSTELSVYVSRRALARCAGAPSAATLDAVAADLVGRYGDPTALDALSDATAVAGGRDAWSFTVVGVGLAPDGTPRKVNVYAAPTPGQPNAQPAPGRAAFEPAAQAGAPTFSNSGWIGSRVGA
jgi:hypothetical protein